MEFQDGNINYNVSYDYKCIEFGCVLMSSNKTQCQEILLDTYFERSYSFIITSKIHIHDNFKPNWCYISPTSSKWRKHFIFDWHDFILLWEQ